MEAFLFCYFDKVFSDLDRGFLMARHKRRQTTQYLSVLIEGCSRGDTCDRQTSCRTVVRTVVDFHAAARRDNGGVCLLGKYHDVLYVAIKLCYDWKLRDTEIVCRLLRDVFACENTFERLFAGAVFGSRATHFLSGWKSDFTDRHECLEAVRYFLGHAALGEMLFDTAVGPRPMVDVPMTSYGGAEPAAVCVRAGRWDVLALLMEYGAHPSHDPRRCGLQLLLRQLHDHAESCPERPLPEGFVRCLRVYVKFLPRVPEIIPDPEDDGVSTAVHPAVLAAVQADKTGTEPPVLQHLCRCAVRLRLALNGALPNGTRKLGLPPSLQSYVDFKDTIEGDV